MKNLIPKIKEQLKTTKGIISIILFVLILLFSIFIGIQYVLVVLLIIGFFIMAKQGEKENKKVFAPWYIDERKKEINEIEKKAEIVRKHIKENPGDLEAKLKLKELEDEISLLKQKYNFE